MITCGSWPVGVCSWSLQKDIAGVAQEMREVGLSHVHLAVGPAAEEGGRGYLAAIQKQDWSISSTMVSFPQEDYSTLESIKKTGGIGPDKDWEGNRKRFLEGLKATAELGVRHLSMHAGFIDHRDPEYARKFTDRIRCLADAAQEKEILLLLETGQEIAEELRHFLKELNHPAIRVNFDPANMILYGKGDPIEAVEILGPWIEHVHIKDAIRTKKPGTWGTEVPWGEGEVGGEAFLRVLKRIGFRGVLAIERESGKDRLKDIRLAAGRLKDFKG